MSRDSETHAGGNREFSTFFHRGAVYRIHSEYPGLIEREIVKLRRSLETYIDICPEFRYSLVPVPPASPAPPLALEMHRAAETVGVGPLAAVAGAMAEYSARAALDAGDSDVIRLAHQPPVKTSTVMQTVARKSTFRLMFSSSLEVSQGVVFTPGDCISASSHGEREVTRENVSFTPSSDPDTGRQVAQNQSMRPIVARTVSVSVWYSMAAEIVRKSTCLEYPARTPGVSSAAVLLV